MTTCNMTFAADSLIFYVFCIFVFFVFLWPSVVCVAFNAPLTSINGR